MTLPKPPLLVPAAELFREVLTRTAAIAVAPIQQGSRHNARAAVARDQARALAPATSLTPLQVLRQVDVPREPRRVGRRLRARP